MSTKLRGIVKSPTGKEHLLATLEEAVRLVVIVSEQLTKAQYSEILRALAKDPHSSYTWQGWSVKVDLNARRAGTGVIVTRLVDNHIEEFSTIKECALYLQLTESKVRTLINSLNNTHLGKRFHKKTW